MALSNHSARVIVSIFAIPIILAASYFGKLFFFMLILGIALISFYEFSAMLENKGSHPNKWLGFIAVIILVSANYINFSETFTFLILFVIIISAVEMFRNKGTELYNIGGTLLATFYISFFAGSLIGIREFYPDVSSLYLRGGLIIISMLASIWLCDSAAYYGGKKFGRRKLFPRISPNKTWEGAIFGFIFAVIAMVIAKFLFLDFLNWSAIIAFGVIIGIGGQIGDLVESLFKRDAGVKDSSALIPGHGGIFDRFDSLLFTAPIILLYLKYFGR